jgi:hypothetical protein
MPLHEFKKHLNGRDSLSAVVRLYRWQLRKWPIHTAR